jgi:hypothetical protein
MLDTELRSPEKRRDITVRQKILQAALLGRFQSPLSRSGSSPPKVKTLRKVESSGDAKVGGATRSHPAIREAKTLGFSAGVVFHFVVPALNRCPLRGSSCRKPVALSAARWNASQGGVSPLCSFSTWYRQKMYAALARARARLSKALRSSLWARAWCFRCTVYREHELSKVFV